MNDAKWDRRIHRANELVSSYPSPPKDFVTTRVSQHFRRAFTGEIQKALADSPKISSDRPLRDELDLFLLLPKFPEFLSLIQQIAPAPLAQASVALAQKGPAAWQHAIEDFWHGEPELAGGVDDTAQVPVFPIECSRGCFFSRTPNILRITAKLPSSTELHRPARFAAASLPSAYCGAKVTVRKSR